jgi:hypothetical protein
VGARQPLGSTPAREQAAADLWLAEQRLLSARVAQVASIVSGTVPVDAPTPRLSKAMTW